MPRALLALARRPSPGGYAAALRALPPRAGDGEGRLGARRRRSRGRPRAPRGAGTVHVGGTEDEFLALASRPHDGLARAPVPAARPAVRRRPDARARGQAHRLGLHARPARASTGRRARPLTERMEAQVERFAPGFRDRILARHVLGPADLEAPQREPRRRRRRRRQLPAATRSSSARVPKLIAVPTPLKGLYIGSAATFPGGAVHGVPGRRRRARRPAGREAPPRVVP